MRRPLGKTHPPVDEVLAAMGLSARVRDRRPDCLRQQGSRHRRAPTLHSLVERPLREVLHRCKPRGDCQFSDSYRACVLGNEYDAK